MAPNPSDRFAGCLLGGAIGDALGAPVEFLSWSAIRATFGPAGVADVPQRGDFTDDTQMTLFTAAGLIAAAVSGVEPAEAIRRAYMRWLHTQGQHPADPSRDVEDVGWMISHKELWRRAAPGGTCLSALVAGGIGSISNPANNSKGCGGVMRVAPVGLVASLIGGPSEVFDLGCEAAAITHGHPSGYLAAGCLAVVIGEIVKDGMLDVGIDRALEALSGRPGAEECRNAIVRARQYARDAGLPRGAETVERMGGGWVAEEALAISLYCALAYPNDFARACCLAVNHSGDSDSTGAITGNILGAALGKRAVPGKWLERLQMSDAIELIARDLLIVASPLAIGDQIVAARYPL